MIRVDETDPVGEIEPSFPYRDVTIRRGVDFKENYDIQSEIGRGKFGTVYHCKEKTSGLQLAAKVVTTTRKEDRRSVEREVEIMRRLQHPRLIQLYDAIDNGKQIYVILELIQGGELFERVIDDDFVLTERSCAVFMRQICEGIEFVHAQHILHLDMKPENILCLTKEGNRIKIIDFGLARQYDPRKKLQVLFGTPEFVAPEVVNFDQIGFGTDMWSIGVICYVLLSGLSPFMGDTDVETMANVTIAKYDFDHDAFADISEDAKDFIRCLLVKDKEKRATATMCRSHRWLASKSPAPMKKKLIGEELKETDERKPGSPRRKNQEAVVTTQVPTTSNMKDELDVTKDNLRLFVERWREHPDSPYMLEPDVGQPLRWEDREIATERTDNSNLELTSLRGQSPSPCGSVCSTMSEVSSSTAEKSNCMLTVPNNIVLGLDRRASEGTAIMSGHRRDQAVQIVLAEEIIKLSEHLRNLAMGQPSTETITPETESNKNSKVQTKDSNEINEKSTNVSINGKQSNNADGAMLDKGAKTKTKTNGTSFSQKSIKTKSTSHDQINNNSSSSETNEISEKLSSITRQRKIKGTTFNGSRSFDKYDNSVNSFNLKKTFSSTKTHMSNEDSNSVGESNSFTEIKRHVKSSTDREEDDRRITWKIDVNEGHDEEAANRMVSGDTKIEENSLNNRDIDLTPPWRRSRTKHRFGETCRDVPRISNLRDIHKSLNLDEPKSTKDLLLHLLGEWDDPTRAGGIGRKSISVDWCGEESVARRSMNSLAEYFQSEQQKSTTNTSVANNASTPSIHR